MLGVCQMQPFRSCVPLCRADVGSWRSGALPFALNSRCIRREGQAQALALLHQSSSLLLQKQRRENAAGRSSSSRRTMARRSNPLGRKKKTPRRVSGLDEHQCQKSAALAQYHIDTVVLKLKYSYTYRTRMGGLSNDLRGADLARRRRRAAGAAATARTPAARTSRAPASYFCALAARAHVHGVNKTLPETPAGRRSLARYQTPPNPLTVKIPPRRPPADGAPHLFRLRWHLNARPFTASTIKAALLDYLSSCKSALMEPP